MKLPEIASKRNRIRDTRICQLYIHKNLSPEEISEQFKLTPTRINQILYKNRQFLNLDAQWEKTKRIRWLKIHIKESKLTRKDPADLIEQMRREIEGDGKNITIDNSNHYQEVQVVIRGNSEIRATRRAREGIPIGSGTGNEGSPRSEIPSGSGGETLG